MVIYQLTFLISSFLIYLFAFWVDDVPVGLGLAETGVLDDK
jgi:hypothetical protein